MSVELIECVKKAIDSIIAKENYSKPPEVIVRKGSDLGDGYSSNNYAIKIKSDEKPTLEIFVKYTPESTNPIYIEASSQAAQSEYRFYEDIYPIFEKFQENKNIKDPFNNAPKHFKIDLKHLACPPIILENLRSLGYTLRDRKTPIDDLHLKLPIQAFARYHAVSFAIKDQEPKLFEELTNGIEDHFSRNFTKYGLSESIKNCVNQFLQTLDPIVDKKMLGHCKDLGETLVNCTSTIPENIDEYAVLGHGDSWSSNMMFLYNEEKLPIDVKLIDWQCQRTGSPLLDISYFFYTSATRDLLQRADYYLNFYYETLSRRIQELGSDPEKVFPKNIFLKHWKKFAPYGLCMAFCIIKAQLFEKDEVPDYIHKNDSVEDSFSQVLRNQDEYNRRIKELIQHFMDQELI